MKLYFIHSILFLFIGFCYLSYAQGLLEGDEPELAQMVEQDPTYVNLPLPSEILVVYRKLDENDIEPETVANYYKQKQGIPTLNLCKITTLPDYKYYEEYGAFLFNDREKVLSWSAQGNGHNAHWLYYKEFIETPIKNYMNENNITETIRYIVLIKGLPYRLGRDPYYQGFNRINASVCALLSLMNQPDERDILDLYNTHLFDQLNPYWDIDYPVTMDYRFKSNHFANANDWYLNYLVSRLDADTYDDVIDLIDRITFTDKSGEKKWILDNQPGRYSTMPLAQDRLDELGFNYIYDNTAYRVTFDNNDIIGYTSHGIYSGFSSYYILNELQF